MWTLSSSTDPVAMVDAAALEYADAEKARTGREPLVEVIFSNRPKYRFRVVVSGCLVADGRDGSIERAAMECLRDFERWVAQGAGVLRRAV